MDEKINTHTDEIFNVYGALDNLNKRLKSAEEKIPDYTADMLEVYRNFGVLTKRISELEEVVRKITDKNEIVCQFDSQRVFELLKMENEKYNKSAHKATNDLKD